MGSHYLRYKKIFHIHACSICTVLTAKQTKKNTGYRIVIWFGTVGTGTGTFLKLAQKNFECNQGYKYAEPDPDGDKRADTDPKH